MVRTFVWVLLGLLVAGNSAVAAETAATAARTVNFHKDIVPILANTCVKCHANANRKGGLSLDTREKLLEGGDSGPVVVVGKSAESLLVELISGEDPDRIMPAQGPRLTAEQIGLVKAWIDQGLAWDEGFTFRKVQAAPLAPRRPTVPESNNPALANPIDRILAPYFVKHEVKVPAVVNDRTYIRRVYLDVIGVLPTADEVRDFLNDPASDKRALLVDRVLADRTRYAEHWLTFWNDALRNDYRGTGYIDGGRREITGWLFASLADNMPYDQFVRELIDPSKASEGFINGIVWRGVVNASQVPPMQAAQNVSQVFMGLNLKCASCHDSFINDWKLKDAYGLASIFSDDNLEVHRCDKPIGEYAKIKFLYPELGSIDANASRENRLAQLSGVITSPGNGRLARTIVNRLWARLLGRGLVEPVDEMDAAAWNADVLDYLAVDLADHGYNLKHTLRRVLTSQAYQLPATAFSEGALEDFVFRGPVVKRMTAEQFVDAVSALTGTQAVEPAVDVRAVIARNLASRASWIWLPAATGAAAPPRIVLMRKSFQVPQQVERAWIAVSSPRRASLHVNGKQVLDLHGDGSGGSVDVMPYLKVGENVIAVESRGYPPTPGKPAMPSSVLVVGRAEAPATDGVGRPQYYDLVSDATWQGAGHRAEGWTDPAFKPNGWKHANVVAAYDGRPGTALAVLIDAIAVRLDYEAHDRAALAYADPLMVALGRPNREQVVTDRPKVATTLQALEMTNGAALSLLLAKGAKELMAREHRAPSELIEKVYNRALGRGPTNDELAASVELVGTPVTADSVEDLLWSVVMLPDFQLIY